jgi:hypothetical protein
MKRHSIARFRNFILISSILTTTYIVLFYERGHVQLIIRDGFTMQRQVPFASSPKVNKRPVRERLHLTEKECRTSFPDLFREIEYAETVGQFDLEKATGDYQGLVQGRIKDNQVRRSQVSTNSTASHSKSIN